MMVGRGRWLWIAPLALIGIAVFITLGGFVVMWLWNWLLPPLFGWHTLTFWQAIALLALSRILFGGFGMRGGGGSRMRWRMGDRWNRMSPEERERFRQVISDMAARWGFGRPADESHQGPAAL
jgi:hypothetical protein